MTKQWVEDQIKRYEDAERSHLANANACVGAANALREVLKQMAITEHDEANNARVQE
jgi:hypothetical protein